MKGYLITIEGIDGAGKSTVLRFLKEKLAKYDPVFTQEPTKSHIGEVVRNVISTDADCLAEAFLFVADHADHVNRVIKPAIECGKIVISDRYSDSRYAYQGVTLSEFFEDPISWLKDLHSGWTIPPDLTILLHVDPQKAVKRCSGRFATSKFEKVEFLREVQKNYLRLVDEDSDRFVVVDANTSLKAMEKEVLESIEKFLPLYIH